MVMNLIILNFVELSQPSRESVWPPSPGAPPSSDSEESSSKVKGGGGGSNNSSSSNNNNQAVIDLFFDLTAEIGCAEANGIGR
ncbi:hypothetical protein C5167_025591 [Papaver somniferum]|uniref:Uncharacterized protein n=1 Tax=Papaver somniferum TaxID=3469 RepID=A0A4Y7JVS7_PAPSO|nr:hypothetical protein C5167_025591 [Papaver somniferum]